MSVLFQGVPGRRTGVMGSEAGEPTLGEKVQTNLSNNYKIGEELSNFPPEHRNFYSRFFGAMD